MDVDVGSSPPDKLRFPHFRATEEPAPLSSTNRRAHPSSFSSRSYTALVPPSFAVALTTLSGSTTTACIRQRKTLTHRPVSTSSSSPTSECRHTTFAVHRLQEGSYHNSLVSRKVLSVSITPLSPPTGCYGEESPLARLATLTLHTSRPSFHLRPRFVFFFLSPHHICVFGSPSLPPPARSAPVGASSYDDRWLEHDGPSSSPAKRFWASILAYRLTL
ncbi:hypothetical protein DFP72DRAFT_886278 [Ephemerocybe angulata]|uniref:Uncharacterized protein n=1 Tax=Ephemerocybe angulata TaxID=980116 RepID=A0A8H6I5K1_9AGAR|nr:hypothetical protein DFP72DRAFT_886278 [Tulosesus angulatus]